MVQSVNYQINSKTLAWWALNWNYNLSTTPQDNFVFNWYSLDNWSSIRVQTVNYDDVWEIEWNIYNAPQTDWWWVLWHFFRAKQIIFRLSLKSNTLEDLNDLVDDFKKNIRETEWDLDIKVNWNIRSTKASLTSLKFNRQFYHITFIQPIELIFSTIEPNWKDKYYTVEEFQNVTSSTLEEVINTSSYKTDYRIQFAFAWSWISWVTQVSIEIDWYEVEIQETITNNDVLIFDWEEKQCTLNWTIIDYSWVFTKFNPWTNQIQFTLNWTFTVDISVLYKNTYL